MTNLRALTIATLTLLVISAGPLAAQKATVRYNPGNRGEVRTETGLIISSDTWKDGLQTRRAGRTGSRFNMKAEEVVRVDWDQAPGTYRKAMNAYDDGSFDKAADLFKEAQRSTGSYKWLPVYSSYYLGKSLARIGAPSEAIEALNQVIQADRNHRFVPDVYDLTAELAMRPGGPGAGVARDALTKLKDLKLGGAYDLKVDLGLARIELRTGDASKAQSALRSLLARAVSAPDVQQLVRLELGNVEVKLGNHTAAESAFKDILESKGTISEEVRAGACNGLGDSLFAQKKWNEAFEAYSKTAVWFYDSISLRDQVGHALYNAGIAMQNHSGPLEGDAKDEAAKIGKKFLNRAWKDFAGTRGGAAAKKALGR